MPAKWTMANSLSVTARTAATADAMLAASVRSARMGITPASSLGSTLRSSAKTPYPRARSACTVARPMPPYAPVIRMYSIVSPPCFIAFSILHPGARRNPKRKEITARRNLDALTRICYTECRMRRYFADLCENLCTIALHRQKPAKNAAVRAAERRKRRKI